MTFRQNLIKLKYTIKEAMKVYSQGFEQQTVLNYFKSQSLFNGTSYANITFLSIGENDGKTLSNTHALALLGAKGTCVEPSPVAFKALQELYKDNTSIHCIEAAVSDYIGEGTLYDSGEHLGKGDTSLLSTLNTIDKEKWQATTEYKDVPVQVIDFAELLRLSPYKTFDFVSMDMEGSELTCLSQMNLTELGLKCICIEHNSDQLVKELMMSYCFNHGLKRILLTNAENIILAK